MTRGRFKTSFWPTVRESEEELVSTRGASATTETTSVTPPGSITASTRALRPTSRAMPVWVNPLKPVRLTSSLYWPTGSSRSAYCPAESVVVLRANCVPRLVAVTIAVGTAAPDVSLTLPRIVPVATWAWALAAGAACR